MEELLSIKLRPKSLKDIIGQEHLVGENKVIYNLVKNLKESNHNEYTGEIFNFMSRKDLEDFSKINLNMKQNKIIP